MNDIWFVLGLFLSHILTDYYFQPTNWVDEKILWKEESWQLYTHAAIAGGIASIFGFISGVQEFLFLFFLVAIPHLLIDLWKLYQPNKMRYYFFDQGMHFIHLLFIVFIFSNKNINMNYILNTSLFLQAAIVITGWLLLWKPTGITIEKLTKKYHKEIDKSDKDKSLPEAGEMIGLLERTLIFIFLLQGQLGAVGFLITAKSILRYSDHKQVKNPIRLSEYVIIGTMMSFSAAIIIGLTCDYLIHLVESLK